MKKYSLSVIAVLICMLSVKAQIYTPNGSIQGVSVNDNIGIGTNQPNAKLTIKAGLDGNPTPLKAISIWGPNSPANSNSAQDLSWDFAAAGSASIRSYRGSNWDTYLQFLTNDMLGGNDPQVRLHIDYAGNVGIGKTNPNYKLDVLGSIRNYETSPLGATINSYKLINDRGGNVGENSMMNRLWFVRDANLNNWYSARLHDGISVDGSFAYPHVDTRTWWERDPLDNIQSWGNAKETYFTINAGNVGIGTTTPDTKLTVNGTIHTKEVKVDLILPMVPDYVFASDYKLKTLQEVEDFINKNNHLPEIPSAAEFEKNGLLLAEMNMSLLKKMEEMTLYMIEQNKKLELQNKKMSSLEKKLEKFELNKR